MSGVMSKMEMEGDGDGDDGSTSGVSSGSRGSKRSKVKNKEIEKRVEGDGAVASTSGVSSGSTGSKRSKVKNKEIEKGVEGDGAVASTSGVSSGSTGSKKSKVKSNAEIKKGVEGDGAVASTSGTAVKPAASKKSKKSKLKYNVPSKEEMAKHGENTKQFLLWSDYYTKNLTDCEWIAPVKWFKKAPFNSNWDEWEKWVESGAYLEVPNIFAYACNPVVRRWWFGEVVGLSGYRVIIRSVKVEGLDVPDKDDEYTTCVSFFSDIPKHIGFCEENGTPLGPVSRYLPDLSESKLNEVKESMKGKPTLPKDHFDKVRAEMRSKLRYVMNSHVEVLDRKDCNKYCLAQITTMVGDRVEVQYKRQSRTSGRDLYWFSQNSPYLHEVGWCNTIGHKLQDVPNQMMRSIAGLTMDVAKLPKVPKGTKTIEPRMVFEMRHPLKPHKIVVGYVINPLKHGYFVAGTDWTRQEERAEIILHITSDYVLPVGFCKENKIGLQLTRCEETKKCPDFDWKAFMKRGDMKPLDLSKVKREPNLFEIGCKLEAINILQPRYIRAATIVKVAGHLIKIHFDGNDRSDRNTFQWVSNTSSNIYPVGYAEMVCHRTIGKPDRPRDEDHAVKKPKITPSPN